MTDHLPGRDTSLLLLCDHASAFVPPDIAIAPALLSLHIGVDIGAGPLTHALSASLDAPAILGTVSRLVIDLHRQSDHPGLVPTVSDGHAIPANIDADRAGRIARFHAPYHRAIRAQVRRDRPRLIVAIHSFTRQLETGDGPRPWEAGILYGRDDRAARIAIDFLCSRGIPTGDQQPYSGRLLNATLDRHADGQGIASLSVEIRNDLIADPAGVARWCAVLTEMIAAVRNGLALNAPLAQ
ncbi:N-formylglutamate amidohydrolase [Sphingomonas sp. Leaf62]|uniref:N-formylglutamate amidohydrolase n=1 Tax=Sphingomonas sp. Leaf62 TaxID=1736228 RepID=UPI0006F32629|nr:N-formylglutamate amidohydrolase [Sphingomonas sp. Leaf62]KQN70898.1 N-formylglutamate amidohydrolase [Sphingomonas sp. Leaf62]